MSRTRRMTHGRRRVGFMLVVLLVTGIPSGILVGALYAPLAGVAFGIAVGWSLACLAFFGVLRAAIRGLDAEETRSHALVEDPSRGTADLLTLGASVVSVLAIVTLVVGTQDAHGVVKLVVALTALFNVAISWTLIHTLYMLTYARIYYGHPEGGIDFNTDVKPRYLDFAYLSFDLGMTYQVSDTSVSTTELRGTILKHTLLSYFFGAVVLASVINLVLGLG